MTNTRPVSLEEIDAYVSPPRNECQTCRWLREQPEDDQRTWDTAFASGRMTVAIHTAMKAHGFGIGITSVESHRRGQHRKGKP